MKVVVIEDDPACRDLLAVRLEHLGCEVRTASTSEEAVRVVGAELPDLVLLDLRLESGMLASELRGIQVFSALRERAETSGIPVVIHSIYVSRPSEAPAAMPTPDGYLFKPFGIRDLRLLLEQFRPQNASPGRRP